MSKQLETVEKNPGKEKLKLRDFPKYATNPAWSNMLLKTKNKTVSISKKGVDLYDPDTGEVSSETAFMAIRKRVDQQAFIKIYQDTVKHLAGLNKDGSKVFWYVMNATKINADAILFDIEECMDFIGYSKTSVWRGLCDLLNKQILYKSKKLNVYFINPAFLFNGDRLVVAHDYVVKNSAIDKAIQAHEEEIARAEFNKQHPLFERADES